MKIWSFVLALFTCALTAYSANVPQSPVSQGMAAFKREDFDGAIGYFTQAIRENTNYVGAYYFRGLSYIQKKDYDHSIADFSRAISLNTNNPDPYYFRGMCYMNEAKYDLSLSDLNRALQLRRNITVLLLRAYVNLQMTNLNQSIEDYNQVIRMKPSNATGYIGRAHDYNVQGVYGLAIMDCDSALSINLYSATAFRERADAYDGEHDFDDAIADYSRALRLDPNDPATCLARSMAYADENDFSNAVASCNEAISLAPGFSEAYCNRGYYVSKLGNYRGGIEDCEKALALDTNSVWANNNLAWLLSIVPDAKLRNGKKALVYAKKACELTDWKEPIFIDTLAAAYAETGHYRKAVKLEKSIIGIMPPEDRDEAQKALKLYQHHQPFREQ
ncbi:MAG TPA: tetratricopeptide repeat protein [Candidatus Acidoferrales bacterium]|nr:tetratricopeptide repeat protein [Candidatus Acidoferrales bacterium]